MANLQVKGVDDALYAALAARARRENRSLSQEVVRLIKDRLATAEPSAEAATLELIALCRVGWSDAGDRAESATLAREARAARRRRRVLPTLVP